MVMSSTSRSPPVILLQRRILIELLARNLGDRTRGFTNESEWGYESVHLDFINLKTWVESSKQRYLMKMDHCGREDQSFTNVGFHVSKCFTMENQI